MPICDSGVEIWFGGKMKRLFLMFFLMFFVSCSIAYREDSPGALETIPTVKTLSERTFLTKGWRLHFGDDLSYREVYFDDHTWDAIDLPRSGFQLKPKVTYYFWLRKRFVIDSSLDGEAFGLVTGKLPDSAEVYVNGSLVGRSGSMPPEKYYGTRHIPRSYLIPGALLNYGGTNTLAIRGYSRAGRLELPLVFTENDNARMQDYMFDYIFNSVFPMLVTFLGFFIAFYFFILFFRDRRGYYFDIAFGLIFTAFYYTNIYLESFPLPFFLVTKFQFISLYFGVLMFVFYLQGFFDLHRYKWLRILLLVLVSGASLSILLSPNYVVFDFLNGSIYFLFLVTPLLFYMLYLSIASIRKGNRYAKILIWGVTAVIGVAVRDIMLASLGNTPRFWMSSWGMIIFIMTTFLSSANYTVDVYEEAKDKSQKLAKQRGNLQILLTRISNVGKNVADQVMELDRVIIGAAAVVSQMVDSNQKILGDLGNQVNLIEENNDSIRNMLSSLNQIFDYVESQSQSVEKSTHIIQNLVDSIREIFQTTEKATIISSQLKKVAANGFQVVKASAESMNAIQSSSEEVREQVDNIFTIAEETNMLSMNAAIQSAHAGEYGKGFAVVAQEVRELANSSSQTSTQIQEQIDTMMKRIREGMEYFRKVEQGLTDISHGTDDTIAMINEIADSAQQQHNETKEVTSAINLLLDATRNLKEQTEVQVAQGERLQSSLTVFSSVATEIEETTKQQSENGSEIVKMVDEIRLFSNKNKEVVLELDKIITEFQSENFDASERVEC